MDYFLVLCAATHVDQVPGLRADTYFIVSYIAFVNVTSGIFADYITKSPSTASCAKLKMMIWKIFMILRYSSLTVFLGLCTSTTHADQVPGLRVTMFIEQTASKFACAGRCYSRSIRTVFASRHVSDFVRFYRIIKSSSRASTITCASKPAPQTQSEQQFTLATYSMAS
eukprot:6213367-Pleurochrysis_carterae.AAC.1